MPKIVVACLCNAPNHNDAVAVKLTGYAGGCDLAGARRTRNSRAQSTASMALTTMETLVYRFDNTEAFGLLDVEGSAESAVSVSLGGTELERFIRIRWARRREDAVDVSFVISLPPRAVDGTPDRWLLDARTDGGACEITLCAGDSVGDGFDYVLGIVDAAVPRILSAPVASPSSFWAERSASTSAPVTPPIEPYRIRLSPLDNCQTLDVRLRTLRVTGEVRLAAPGIA